MGLAAKRQPLEVIRGHSGSPGCRGPNGFTLIETALATVIVGVGVLSIVAAQQAFHKQNAWSTNASTATRLGNEIREMTFRLPRHDPVTGLILPWGPEDNELWVGDFDDLDDFDDDPLADHQPAAVVGLQREGVDAVGRHFDEAGEAQRELIAAVGQ